MGGMSERWIAEPVTRQNLVRMAKLQGPLVRGLVPDTGVARVCVCLALGVLAFLVQPARSRSEAYPTLTCSVETRFKRDS